MSDAATIADLHRSAIATSFISSLGRKFTTNLYKGVLSSPSAFGFGYRDSDGKLVGYIACTENTSRTYRQSLLRKGSQMAVCLLRYIWRPSVLGRLWETLHYPLELPDVLPKAEVLSIAISAEAHGRGVGSALMREALVEFTRRGILSVRVAVGAQNTSANEFYKRCGFHLAMTRPHHDQEMNIYVIDLPVPS